MGYFMNFNPRWNCKWNRIFGKMWLLKVNFEPGKEWIILKLSLWTEMLENLEYNTLVHLCIHNISMDIFTSIQNQRKRSLALE